MDIRVNVLLGIITGLIWSFVAPVSIVEISLGLAFLVLVPLLLNLVIPGEPVTAVERYIDILCKNSFPFAIFALIAITVDSAAMSIGFGLVWFAYTFAIGLGGGYRLLKRGLFPAEETIMDVGIMFLSVGGVWLVLSEGGIHQLLPYDELTMSLTAVHYHYSAVVIPILTGAFGRLLVREKRVTGSPYRYLAIGTAIGSPLIALGVIQGPPLEFVYVSIYAVFLTWLSVWWLIILPRIGTLQKVMITIASLSLLVSTATTFLYALGVTIGTTIISYEDMFQWHGAVNALGFSFFGALVWNSIGPLKKRELPQE
ncbi:YndJ family protein [Paenalkalicoccus suaedae]|uniref:YndJ family protein n=1 Tax=Paenalkalicoccus suaedae TaxID=2592382 RepID=A0A859FAW3_9BACI|nr:YndJ family transporter [Paenalkalicoccus suaedae]QKS70080.1 YndJ family protein [Paenalkalicoccus suaedae]